MQEGGAGRFVGPPYLIRLFFSAIFSPGRNATLLLQRANRKTTDHKSDSARSRDKYTTRRWLRRPGTGAPDPGLPIHPSLLASPHPEGAFNHNIPRAGKEGRQASLFLPGRKAKNPAHLQAECFLSMTATERLASLRPLIFETKRQSSQVLLCLSRREYALA